MPIQIITADDLIKACERSDRGDPEPAPQTKPPLGIVPRRIHTECRLNQIVAGINRYHAAGKAIPPKWFEEAAELTRYLRL